jgi:hypothetical protein
MSICRCAGRFDRRAIGARSTSNDTMQRMTDAELEALLGDIEFVEEAA